MERRVSYSPVCPIALLLSYTHSKFCVIVHYRSTELGKVMKINHKSLKKLINIADVVFWIFKKMFFGFVQCLVKLSNDLSTGTLEFL